MNVLADPHSPQDHGSGAGRVESGDLADGFRGNAADRRHQVRTVAGHVLDQFRVAQCAVGDELRVDQVLLDDDMHHGVEQRHIGVRLELQIAVCRASQLAASRIHQDQLGTVAHRILQEGRRHRVVHRRIRADQDHNRSLGHIHHRIADGP